MINMDTVPLAARLKQIESRPRISNRDARLADLYQTELNWRASSAVSSIR